MPDLNQLADFGNTGPCPKCGKMSGGSVSLQHGGRLTIQFIAGCDCGVPFVWNIQVRDQNTVDIIDPLGWVTDEEPK